MPRITVTPGKGLVQKGGTSTTNGTLSGHKAVVETLTTSQTLDTADSGKVFLIATDSLTITLPATEAGLVYTFINSGADGNNIITISPNASDAIHGTVTLAGSVVEFSGSDDADIVNTKATANTGDMIQLIGDGSAGWYSTMSQGIWANA